MVGLMAQVSDVEANCAICGAPPVPECPHEGERLKLAMDQAMERWAGGQSIREWVLSHARNQILATFHHLRALRMQQHVLYLETLPFYALYHRYNGAPPLQPAQLQLVHAQINQANQLLQAGVDQDWRTSCQRYPEVLDYYFNLIDTSMPPDSDPMIQDPRFGGNNNNNAAGGGGNMKGVEGPRRVVKIEQQRSGDQQRQQQEQQEHELERRARRERQERRQQEDELRRHDSHSRPRPQRRGSSMEIIVKDQRKRENGVRRRERAVSPPPLAPMPGSYSYRR